MAGVDAVVSMLPNGKIVESVYEEDVIGHAPASSAAARLFDHRRRYRARRSTADAGNQGYAMVDAPVSGGIAAANGGTLTFMVGGAQDAFATR